RLRRLARQPRRVGEPSQPRLDPPAPGPPPGGQRQEDGGPHGRRERHHAEFARGEDRPGARSDHDPRRGAGGQGRLGAVARCGEAGLAGGRAEAWRFSQRFRRGSERIGEVRGASRAGTSRGGERTVMQADVTTLDAQKAGTVELPDDVFGLEPRPDILHRMVRYQLAKRRAGTRSVQDRSEVNYTGAKLYRQKGTGRARPGARRAEGSSPAPLRQPPGAAIQRRWQVLRPEPPQPRHRAAEKGARARAEAR